MAGWHHQLNGHEFEQALGDDKGQGSLVCYSPLGCKESHTIEQLTIEMPLREEKSHHMLGQGLTSNFYNKQFTFENEL